MSEILGAVNSIQTLGAVDGPGIRVVVFMQGCNLRCGYCHNPETWSFEGGKLYTASKLFEKIVKYKPYFSKRGGVTFSGGEAAIQSEFLIKVIQLCKENDIHTCLDTSGSVYNDNIDSLLDMIDLVLLDIKMTDNESYLKYIGCTLDTVKYFLDKLEEKGRKTWIRQVIIPTFNDNEENLRAVIDIVKNKNCVEKIQLLPFNKISVHKYQELNIPFAFEKYPQGEKEKIKLLQEKLNNILKTE